jgi:regulator of cell morphogenesis and NO signaling
MDPKTTLADLITHHPSLASELDRRGLDYCCGGKETLQDACTRQGLDPARVAAELTVLAGEPVAAEWTTLPLGALVEHIERTHHHYLWEELPRLTALLARVVAAHGQRHPELAEVASSFEEIRGDLEPHLRKEEQVLFPLLRQLAADSRPAGLHRTLVGHPITIMLHEHDTIGSRFARLRGLTHGYRAPRDACTAYHEALASLRRLEIDTHLHVHKENHRLFPLALELEERLLAPR